MENKFRETKISIVEIMDILAGGRSTNTSCDITMVPVSPVRGACN